MRVCGVLSVAVSLLAGHFTKAGPPSVALAIPSELLRELAEAGPASPLWQAIDRLGDPDFRTRERAAAEIRALGERAAAPLRRALPRVADAEARRRLASILAAFDLDRLTTARRVSLVESQITAPAAFRQIARDAGYPIRIDAARFELPGSVPRYAFQLRNVPFWEAMDAVANASGWRFHVDDEGILHLQSGEQYSPMVAYSGPYRFLPRQVESHRATQLNALSRTDLLRHGPETITLQMGVTSEPKAPVIAIRHVWLTKVIDSENVELVIPPRTELVGSAFGFPSKGHQQNLQLTLVRPRQQSSTLKEIRGTVSMLVLSDIRPDVEIADLARAVKGQRQVGRQLELEIRDIQTTRGERTLTVEIVNPSAARNDYSWIGGLFQRMDVTDTNGVKRPITIQGTNYQSSNRVVLSFSVGRSESSTNEGALTLSIREWVSRTIDVEFTLKDVPLP